PRTPAGGLRCGRRSRCRTGTAPRNARPRSATTTPRTRWMTSSQRTRCTPTAPAANMSATNTRVNPATNSPTPARTRPRLGAATRVAVGVPPDPTRPPPALAAAIPQTYPTYPGTRGSTHGDAKDTSPARIATGTARSIDPLKTVVANVSPTLVAAAAGSTAGAVAARGARETTISRPPRPRPGRRRRAR